MKKLTFFISFIVLTSIYSCGQNKIKTPISAMNKFEEFISKEKFLPDSKIFYPGIGDEKLKTILTKFKIANLFFLSLFCTLDIQNVYYGKKYKSISI